MSKRLYPHNRIRYWYVYDLDEVCALFQDTSLHVQTIRKWLNKDGLKPIDGSKPILIYGHSLIEFLKAHNSKGKCATPFDKIFCMKCQDARPIYQGKIKLEHKNNFLKVSGCCSTCKTLMFKNYKMDDYSQLKRAFHVVDVLELYDCEIPTSKTHLTTQEKPSANESKIGEQYGDLFA